MDRLKDFIDSNKEEFENLVLPEGHSDRFKKKFDRQRKLPVQRRLAWFMAAACMLGLLLTMHIQYEKNKQGEVCELSAEIRDVRMYYNMQITATVAQMEKLYKENQSPGTLDLLKQTQEVMASNNDFENKVLPSLPCSEAAIFAMNQHYDASLAGMNILLSQMQRVVDENGINN